ncbi:AAC(3) family N-acetyltransferase [Streptomyces sp.]|uniref:AAC(3) family N-acetyltransferase n=1 Tax=Streptomyces sp. TaxID=1931 RepID=UPI0035C6C56C
MTSPRSCLGELHRLDAGILLLGVGHERNTSLHLAGSRAGLPVDRVANGTPPSGERGAPSGRVRRTGRR